MPVGINLLNQTNNTNVDNVKFDLYLSQSDKSQNTITKDINAGDIILYAQVKVQNGGVLNEATLSIGERNFNIKQGSELKFDTIVSGQSSILEIPIEAIKGEKFNLGLLNSVSEITLKGKYTNNEGEEVELESTKNIKITWDLEVEEDINAILEQSIITNKIMQIEGARKRIVQLLVKSGMERSIFPVKQSILKIDVAVHPEDVVVSAIRHKSNK